METFFFSISCLFSPRRNQQRQQQPPAKRQRKRYLERLHQQNIHRRSWSQCLTDKSFLAASHRRAFSGGNFTHMKKGRLLRVMGDLGKRRSGCFISHEKAREAPVREMQTVTRKLLFLFYLFTQARPIKQRPGLAAFQPAAGKKPFPLINAGNPDQGNIFFFFRLATEVASQTIFMVSAVWKPPSLDPSQSTGGGAGSCRAQPFNSERTRGRLGR